LSELLGEYPEPVDSMRLPPIRGEYELDKVVIAPFGARMAVIKELTLKIPVGSQLGVIGPSAAGKSTLLRALLGLNRPHSGTLRLDGAELSQYSRAVLGSAIGYLPQDVELLDGTISENIARFGDIDAEAVVRAARRAGVHEMILALPDGYETRLEGNFTLSAGQRQRVALARALYKDPAVVILDEPNSNLDEAGSTALMRALDELREIGSTVVIVTHRNGVLERADAVLLLVDGKLALHGTPEQVSASLAQRRAQHASAKTATGGA
jgi:ATP-binding cassette subfamily C protein EexD